MRRIAAVGWIPLVVACVAGGAPSSEDGPVAAFEAPGPDGKADGSGGPDPELAERLTEAHGVRPRRYNGLFDGSNLAEWQFVRLLPEVGDFVNERLRARGHDVRLHDAEIATNFITEGGFFPLRDNLTRGIDGYMHLGIDTLVDNYEVLSPYLHPIVHDAVQGESDAEHSEQTNERGEKVTTLTDMTLEEGLYASAGMLAWAKLAAAGDIRDRGESMADLEMTAQFFWATVYFNAGPGTGASLLADNGIDYYMQRWEREDDPYQYSRVARYNALWRTASYEFMIGTVYVDGPPTVPETPPEPESSSAEDTSADGGTPECDNAHDCAPDESCVMGSCTAG